MEEKKYLYPTENVSPIEVGENYKDYLLSDIINSDTRHLEYVSLLRRGDEVVIMARLYDNTYGRWVRLTPIGGKKISLDKIPLSGFIFGDAVIRFSNDTEEPYVVSLVCYDNGESIKLSDFE